MFSIDRKAAALVGFGCALGAFSAMSFAGGFQTNEQTGSVGDYFAGGAAQANDASTEFYNAAGMVRLKRPEIGAGLAYIPLKINYSGATSAGGAPIGLGAAESKTNNFIPNVHFVYPINNKMAVGFGVNTPFGLATNYPTTVMPVAAAATTSKIMTLDFTPSFAYALTPQFSVAAGADIMYGKASYNAIPVSGAGSHSFSNKLDGTNIGWHVGALYQLSDRTRFGVNYRSAIDFKAKGTSTFTNDPTAAGATSTSNSLSATLHLPSVTSLSMYQQANEKLSVMMSAVYTDWSVFNQLTFNNTASPTSPTVTTNTNYKSTWRFALGAHYQLNDQFMLKAGVGYDRSPVRDLHRDIRLPDVNKIAASIGIKYQYSKPMSIDAGYLHFFAKDATIDNSQTGSAFTTRGTASSTGNIFGFQVNYVL